MEKINRYFERIGLPELRFPQPPSLGLLQTLHQQHLQHIPVENLDVVLGREIALSVPKFYAKLVEDRRGGVSYETNGLFYWVLTMLGFQTDLVACLHEQVALTTPDGQRVAEPAVLVTFEEQAYLCDVGQIGGFPTPLALPTAEQEQVSKVGHTVHFLRVEGDAYSYVQQKNNGAEERVYTFRTRDHKFAEFEPSCTCLQTHEDSPWRTQRYCGRATEQGFIALFDQTLVRQDEAHTHTETLNSPAEFVQILQDEFGISLY